MIDSVFILLIFVSAALTIYSKSSEKNFLLYFFKPLTMILIISYGYYLSEYNSLYSKYILTALLFSLIGDVFLMFPRKLFIAGLISFLIAHLVYTVSFINKSHQANFYLFIPVLIITFGYYLMLNESLGKMKYPVLAYLTVISLMLWAAINQYTEGSDIKSLFIYVGAILFVISDSTLAYNKFKNSFKNAEVMILSTYFLAQTLFVLSI